MKVLNLMEKAAKWYFTKSAMTNAWLATGTVPPMV